VKEHRKEVDSITGIFTRAEKTRAASICTKPAITDHVYNENHHVIDWENAKVIDRESDKADRIITPNDQGLLCVNVWVCRICLYVCGLQVTFESSVCWMSVEFDGRCGTAQNEDCLQLYIAAPSHSTAATTSCTDADDALDSVTWWPVLSKFHGVDGWPTSAVILPGETSTLPVFTCLTPVFCLLFCVVVCWSNCLTPAVVPR